MNRFFELLLVFLVISCFLVSARTFDEAYEEFLEQDSFKISENFYDTPERIILSSIDNDSSISHLLTVRKPYELVIGERVFLFRLSSFSDSSLTLDFFKEKEVFLYGNDSVKFDLNGTKISSIILQKELEYAVVEFSLEEVEAFVIEPDSKEIILNDLPGEGAMEKRENQQEELDLDEDNNDSIAPMSPLILYLIIIFLVILFTSLFFLVLSKKKKKVPIVKAEEEFTKANLEPSNVIREETMHESKPSEPKKELTPGNISSFDEYEALKEKLKNESKKKSKK